MEEKGLDFTKPPLDLSPPVDRSVPRCCLMRQIGYKQKKTLVPNELQWAAEDSMINRSHEEFVSSIYHLYLIRLWSIYKLITLIKSSI